MPNTLALPAELRAGISNAAGLIHSATVLPPGGVSGCAGQQGTLRAGVIAVRRRAELVTTFTGKPVRASAVVVISQLPAMALAIPRWFSIGLPRPKGVDRRRCH